MKIFDVKEIVENVDRYKGQYVHIQGLLRFEFEGNCIIHYPKNEMNFYHYKSSIFISPAMNFRFEEAVLEKWSGKRVIVGGTIYGPAEGFGGCGHMSLWPAEMTITQLDLFKEHFVDD